MDFFISDAMAQAGGAQGNPYSSLIFIVVIFAVFYFMLIRPQVKRQKQHKSMVDALSKGDEVVTTGGLLGKVTEVGDSFVDLKISESVTVKLQKHAIATVVPKGTIKDA